MKVQLRPTHLVSLIVALAIIGAAVWILARQFSSVSIADLIGAVRNQSPGRIAASIALTAVSFLALATYDVFAANVVAPGRVHIGLAAFAGAAGNAISNTLGFHAITGSAVRYRIYRSAGLSVGDVTRIISLSWAALGLGFIAMLTIAMLVDPAASAPSFFGIPIRWIGVATAAALGGLLVWLFSGTRRLRIGRFAMALPPGKLAALQMLIGALEMGAAVAGLYVLLPGDLASGFAAFSIAFVGSILLGVVSHAPGGIGVFEAAIVSFLAGGGRADLLAALLLYRLIYNLLPFAIAAVSLFLFELVRSRAKLSSKADRA